MRVIHTSDWHLGRTFHGVPLLEAQAGFLSWLLELALERSADAVVVAGDVYDRAVPPVEAVALLDRTLAAFAAAGIPVLLISGNHDNAVRLGFGGDLAAAAQVHLRTSLAQLAEPVVLTDEHGEVGIYGIPYLVPDVAMAALGAERSHQSVLRAAAGLVAADARARGLTRTVVAAHAFVAGGEASQSERDIAVGGIGDTPAGALAGCSYVALGHLHGPQEVPLPDSPTVLRYSGSPLAFSFSERHHTKSVTVVDLDAHGRVAVELVPTPVPRPLVEVTGTLDELLARGRGAEARHADAWVRAVITDSARPMRVMESLREVWPHTVDLDFRPEGAVVDRGDVITLTATTDPLDVCAAFVSSIGGSEPTPAETAVLQAAVESVAHGRAEA